MPKELWAVGYTGVCVYVCMYRYIYICMHIYIYVCICIHVHTYLDPSLKNSWPMATWAMATAGGFGLLFTYFWGPVDQNRSQG